MFFKKKLISHSSEGWKSEFKVLADSTSVRGTSGSKITFFYFVITWWKGWVSSLGSLFHECTNPTHEAPLSLPNYTPSTTYQCLSGIKFNLWIMWGHKHSVYALFTLLPFACSTHFKALILLEKGIIKLIYKYHYHRTPTKINLPFNSMTFPITDCHHTTISNKWFPNTGVFYIWQKLKFISKMRSDLKSYFFSTSQKNLVAMSLRIKFNYIYSMT